MTDKKRQTHRPFTEPEIRYVKELIGENCTAKDIASRIGRHPSSVKGFLQRKGWKAKPSGHWPQANFVTREERDRIASQFSGTSYQDDMAMRSAIAVEAGRSESVTRSICNWIHGRPVCSTSKIYNDPVPEHLRPTATKVEARRPVNFMSHQNNHTKHMNHLEGRLAWLETRVDALLNDLGEGDND